MEAYVHTMIYTKIVYNNFILYHEKSEPPKSPSTGESTTKLWCLHAIEYYSATKKNYDTNTSTNMDDSQNSYTK